MNTRRSKFFVACIVAVYLNGCGLIASSHRTEDYTPVFAAADACDLSTVRGAVEKDASLLKATEWDNATLLHDGVGHNCGDLVAYLLEKGADANATKTDGVTPLHLAAQRGSIDIMGLLLRHGAHINAVDAKGWTPLDRAKKWDHADAAEFLRQHGGREGKDGS